MQLRRFSISRILRSTPEIPVLPEEDSKAKYFDYLKKENFSEAQADAIVSLVSEAIQESMQSVTKTMVTKSEQEKQQELIYSSFGDLKTTLKSLSEKNVSLLKSDLNRFQSDVSALEVYIREHVNRVQGNLVLDMNLEKSRSRDEFKDLETKLNDVQKGIDQEIELLHKKVDEIHQDIKKTTYQLMLLSFLCFAGKNDECINDVQDIRYLPSISKHFMK